MGVLDDKTVLICGGGNGIGKECALLAAREGANVLVNDLGGALTDDGSSSGDAGLAEQVAQEIREAGGQAASNSESVTDMTAVQGMIEQAKDTFGGLHGIHTQPRFGRPTPPRPGQGYSRQEKSKCNSPYVVLTKTRIALSPRILGSGSRIGLVWDCKVFRKRLAKEG